MLITPTGSPFSTAKSSPAPAARAWLSIASKWPARSAALTATASTGASRCPASAIPGRGCWSWVWLPARMAPIALVAPSPAMPQASSCFLYCMKPDSPASLNATDRNDGLTLKDLYITAAVRCAPPDNKPLPQELLECSRFLDRELAGLEKVKVVVALGKIGFDAYLNYVKRRGLFASKQSYLFKNFPFKHGASYRLPDGKVLLASYHPSNQNTQTGKLTQEMFVKIFKQAARLADE